MMLPAVIYAVHFHASGTILKRACSTPGGDTNTDFNACYPLWSCNRAADTFDVKRGLDVQKKRKKDNKITFCFYDCSDGGVGCPRGRSSRVVSDSSTGAKRSGVSQGVGELSLVLFSRHGDPLAADVCEDEDGGERVGAAAQDEKAARAPPSRASVSEKVTGLASSRRRPREATPSRDLLLHQVNKETSMDPVQPYHHCSAVRPKERRPDVHQQNAFMRGNTIIRSKTFSPGPQSQYICRVRKAP